MTHGSDAKVRSLTRQRQLRPPPASAFAPGPPSGPRREPSAARRGGGAAGNPLTHRLLQATGPGATARVRRALFAGPLRLFPHNLDQAARTTAALSRPRSPLPRTEPRDPVQPACAVRLRAGAGLRACLRLSAARRRGCREAESPNVLPRVDRLGLERPGGEKSSGPGSEWVSEYEVCCQ